MSIGQSAPIAAKRETIVRDALMSSGQSAPIAVKKETIVRDGLKEVTVEKFYSTGGV